MVARVESYPIYRMCPILHRMYLILYRMYPILYHMYPILYRMYPILYRMYPISYRMYLILHRMYPILYRMYPILYRMHPIALYPIVQERWGECSRRVVEGLESRASGPLLYFVTVLLHKVASFSFWFLSGFLTLVACFFVSSFVCS